MRTYHKPVIAGALCAAVAMLSPLAGRAAAQCVGDCDGNGAVTINELIVGVNMALGTAPQTQCPSFDADHSGTVTINELITAVNSALNGCPREMPVLLQGPPGRLAVDATLDLPPVAVGESEIQDGIILTRLDLHLTPDATVGQVNAALGSVNGGIVSMMRGQPTVTIAIPRPADLDALDAVVQTLRGAPGISWTAIAHEAQPNVLPPSPAGDNQDQLSHLLPARFPAAWNASHLAFLATQGCATGKVTLLVVDRFKEPPLVGAYANLLEELPGFHAFGSVTTILHGYDVAVTAGGMFDTANPTGANPFSDCLEIVGIQIAGLTTFEVAERIALSLPAGKSLLNYSNGYVVSLSKAFADACEMNGCSRNQVEMEMGGLPLTLAYDAADWIRVLSSRQDDFLVSTAAGNERDKLGADIYWGLGAAAFESEINAATLLPDDAFLSSEFDWLALPPYADLPILTASSAEKQVFEQYMHALGVDTNGPADNVLIVGSTIPGRSFDLLEESSFSNSGPDLYAVGEHVFTFGGFTQGTSFAAPQVAGLASYLWLLSPDLRNRPVSDTREAILANTRGIGVIDAYASALSLDGDTLPTTVNAPVRLALLDLDNNGKFDENDLSTFLDKLFTGDDTKPDYSRFDLNGDGFTGGPTGEHFDLDRIGSTQYGQTDYSTVMQTIEGETISFDESDLTDLQILCYYAYSDLYKGDKDMRKQLTAGSCGVSVDVTPKAATLGPGGKQQFAAKVRGTADPRVTWRVASGSGSISDTGLFTAGQGNATVRAVSMADPNAFGEATVTVNADCNFVGSPVLLHLLIGNRPAEDPIVLDASSPTTLTDSAHSPGFMNSATVREGFVQVAASDDDPASGVPGRPAVGFGEFRDEFIINPMDPALNGTGANITFSMRVTASMGVSGDRAAAIWTLSANPFVFSGQAPPHGFLSTVPVPGQTSGDLPGGTYAVTIPSSSPFARLGQPFLLDVTFSATVGVACKSGEPCPPPGLTGSGHVQGTFQWLGIKDVKTAAGNSVPFTVCSASGANWAGMP